MIKFRNCSYLKALRRYSEGKNSVIILASGFSFSLENNFPYSVQELAVKIKRHLLKKICFIAWSFYTLEYLVCYEFTKQHCCSLITVKNIVTMYTGFEPCSRGNLLLILWEMLFKVQKFFSMNSRLPLVQGSITSTKYLVINSTGNSSIPFNKVFTWTFWSHFIQQWSTWEKILIQSYKVFVFWLPTNINSADYPIIRWQRVSILIITCWIFPNIVICIRFLSGHTF